MSKSSDLTPWGWAWRIVWCDGSHPPLAWHITHEPEMADAVPKLQPSNCAIECVALFTLP